MSQVIKKHGTYQSIPQLLNSQHVFLKEKKECGLGRNRVDQKCDKRAQTHEEQQVRLPSVHETIPPISRQEIQNLMCVVSGGVCPCGGQSESMKSAMALLTAAGASSCGQ